MTTAIHRPKSKKAYSSAWPPALNANAMETTPNEENRSRNREKTGTRVAVNAAVPMVIKGSAVAGHAVKNVVSRKAFAAT